MVKKSFQQLSRIAKKAVKTRKERESKTRKINAGLTGARTRLTTGGHTEKTQALKREVFSVYSKKLSKSNEPCCHCCGENTSLDFLCIDHIDGRKNRKKVDKRRGSALYSFLKRNSYPSGYQVLCWNCNSTKFVYLACPHKRKTERKSAIEFSVNGKPPKKIKPSLWSKNSKQTQLVLDLRQKAYEASKGELDEHFHGTVKLTLTVYDPNPLKRKDRHDYLGDLDAYVAGVFESLQPSPPEINKLDIDPLLKEKKGNSS